MSKAVKWSGSFQSIGGVNYRLDIYCSDYTGDPVEILFGETPITTDEDTSDDFFAPIRPQTGILNVLDPDGTLMEELLPMESTDRPVRLVNVDSSTVVWQGFLSCEAYTQTYTDAPQVLSIPLKGSLDTMGGVEIVVDDSMAFATILKHLTWALYSFSQAVDVSGWFGNVYFPNRYYTNLRDKYLYNNCYVSAEELTNGEDITFDIHGVSCRQLFEDVSKFFGCVVRESGNNIFMTDCMNYGHAAAYQYFNFALLVASILEELAPLSPSAAVFSNTQTMASMEWMGEQHSKSVRHGARRIKLSASLKAFECDMQLPGTPYGSLVQSPEMEELYVNTNDDFYSLATFKYMRSQIECPGNSTDPFVLSLLGYRPAGSSGYQYTIFWTDSEFQTNYKALTQPPISMAGTTEVCLTSFFTIWKDASGVAQNGLMLCGFPKYMRYGDSQYWTFNRFALTENNALYTQTTPLTFSASSGWININMMVSKFFNTSGQGVYGGTPYPALTLAFAIGGKWWDGSAWSDSFATFRLELSPSGTTVSNKTDDMDTSESEGYFIPITEFMAGVATLKIYHEFEGWSFDLTDQIWVPVMEVLLSKLDVKYVPTNKVFLSNRNSNRYMMNTGKNFEEEVSVQVPIATNASNDISASMIWDDSTTPTALMTLDNVIVRPETDLLERMADFYRAPRKVLSLEVAHPTVAPLPALLVDGYDGTVFSAVAGCRDWAADKETLKLIEHPTT